MCYFSFIRTGNYKDKNDLFVKTVKTSVYAYCGSVCVFFVIFPKIFIFTCYLAFRLLGITNLETTHTFALINNQTTVDKLIKNEWDIQASKAEGANIYVDANIGFHLGDIYLICKPDSYEMFQTSLRINLAEVHYSSWDDKSCIAFKKGEIEIVQINIK